MKPGTNFGTCDDDDDERMSFIVAWSPKISRTRSTIERVSAVQCYVNVSQWAVRPSKKLVLNPADCSKQMQHSITGKARSPMYCIALEALCWCGAWLLTKPQKPRYTGEIIIKELICHVGYAKEHWTPKPDPYFVTLRMRCELHSPHCHSESPELPMLRSCLVMHAWLTCGVITNTSVSHQDCIVVFLTWISGQRHPSSWRKTKL